jgi:tetratricopeptide (TPR) repeat protein
MGKHEEWIELAWAQYHAGEFQAALDIVSKVELTGELRKIAGLAHFQLQQFDQALERLHRFALDEGTYLDWFSVSTTAAMAKRSEMALDAFAHCQALLPKEGPHDGPSLAQLHWYFLQAMAQAGFAPQLPPLLDYLERCYGAAKITDPQYLLQRDLPFWEDFLAVARPIWATMPLADAEARVAKLSKAVDAPGKASLKTALSG